MPGPMALSNSAESSIGFLEESEAIVKDFPIPSKLTNGPNGFEET